MASMSSWSKSTPASWAAASRCRTVLVDPPIATSRRMALLNADFVAIDRGRTEASSSSYQRRHRSTTRRPALMNRSRRAAAVARVEPLPGWASPIASSRQFMEFAVNIPEHEPQVGQALASIRPSSSSLTFGSTAAVIALMRSREVTAWPSRMMALPASMGPPETNTVGMLSRSAASSIPGVILSQLEMHTNASAQWAFTMYSTASAISSRLGSEYSIPPCPMAMPSSTAMVLNSRPTAPASLMAPETSFPMSRRWT